VRGLSQRIQLTLCVAEADPSSGAQMRATFSHKGRRKKEVPSLEELTAP
jgi:hypothetical protein